MQYSCDPCWPEVSQHLLMNALVAWISLRLAHGLSLGRQIINCCQKILVLSLCFSLVRWIVDDVSIFGEQHKLEEMLNGSASVSSSWLKCINWKQPHSDGIFQFCMNIQCGRLNVQILNAPQWLLNCKTVRLPQNYSMQTSSKHFAVLLLAFYVTAPLIFCFFFLTSLSL